LTAVTTRGRGPNNGCIASITPVGAARMDHALLVAVQQLEPVGTHRGQRL